MGGSLPPECRQLPLRSCGAHARCWCDRSHPVAVVEVRLAPCGPGWRRLDL